MRCTHVLRILAWFAPNQAAFLLVVLGFLTEAALLACADDNLYQSNGLMAGLVLLLLLWYWLTLGWIFWAVARLSDRLTAHRRPWLRYPANALLVLLAIAGLLLYVGSWGLYLNAGQFANLASVEFIVNNTDNTRIFWGHIIEAEQWVSGTLIVTSIALAMVVPLLSRWLVRARWPGVASPSIHCLRGLVWVALTIVGLAGLSYVWVDPSDLRRAAHLDALARRFNPAVTLSASSIQAITSPRIEPCIDVAELQPLAASDYQAPPATARNRPSIVFVAIEALRHDVIDLRHQGREVTPHLNALSRNGLRFSRAYAQSTHSDYSDVTIVSSLYPLRTPRHHYYRRGDPWPKTLLYDLLKPAGYATAIISSQNEGWGGMDKFLDSRNLDLFYDAARSGAQTWSSELDSGLDRGGSGAGALVAGKLHDNDTTSRAIAWICEQDQAGRPFFLTMNFQSSHFPYLLAPGTEQPFQPCQIDFNASFIDYPIAKTPVVRNAYCNGIHECDRQLGRLLATLRDLGKLDDTIVVVYGENGEAFHENGLVNHAQAPYEPSIHVACTLHAPAYLRPAVEDYPLELIDVTPTILGLIGWPPHANFQGIDVLAADRTALAQRLLFIHTENPLSRTDAVLLAGRWKLLSDRNTTREYLFDLQSDPGETNNLLAQDAEQAARLRTVLRTWRDRQLAYYHYPHYYTAYYPPRPPGFTFRAR